MTDCHLLLNCRRSSGKVSNAVSSPAGQCPQSGFIILEINTTRQRQCSRPFLFSPRHSAIVSCISSSVTRCLKCSQCFFSTCCSSSGDVVVICTFVCQVCRSLFLSSEDKPEQRKWAVLYSGGSFWLGSVMPLFCECRGVFTLGFTSLLVFVGLPLIVKCLMGIVCDERYLFLWVCCGAFDKRVLRIRIDFR